MWSFGAVVKLQPQVPESDSLHIYMYMYIYMYIYNIMCTYILAAPGPAYVEYPGAPNSPK